MRYFLFIAMLVLIGTVANAQSKYQRIHAPALEFPKKYSKEKDPVNHLIESKDAFEKLYKKGEAVERNMYLKRCLDTLDFSKYHLIYLQGTYTLNRPLTTYIRDISKKNGRLNITWGLSHIAQGTAPPPATEQTARGLYTVHKTKAKLQFEYSGFVRNNLVVP